MNDIRHILVACLLCICMASSAQTYEQTMRRHVWSGSANVNGMRHDTVSVSYAELKGSYEGGKFRDTWQPRHAWTAGASTASVRHLDRMTLAGDFSFGQTEGYGQCGSMFIKPGTFPVDVLEFTPGRKTLQTYSFNGGISYDIAPKFRIGAMMDFESSNIAKRKDLRHSNYRLDMMVSPGMTYSDGDLILGANYIFRKVSETVEPEQIGTKESSFYAFLDKGMMYGTYSVWSGNGLHLDEAGVKGFPVREMYSGLAMQLQYKDFYSELGYSRISGTVGEKDFIWFRYPGNEIFGHVGYKHDASAAVHYMRLSYGWKNVNLNESVLEKVTEGGVTNVFCHGANQILSKSEWNICPEYEYASERIDVIAHAGLNGSHSVSSQIYPYLYAQELLKWSVGVETKLYLESFNEKMKGLELDAGFRYDDGMVSEDRRMVSESAGAIKEPFRLQDYHDMQMEYATAPAMNFSLAMRYSFWKGLYVKASAGLLCGMALRYLPGHTRTSASLSLGYDF